MIITAIIVGLSGMIAQVLLLRELLINFHAGALGIGIIIANWIILEASGAFITSRIIERIKKPFNLFFYLQIIFALALPCSVFLAQTFKHYTGITSAELPGLIQMCYVSFIILIPLGFSHGALFTVLFKLFKKTDFAGSDNYIGSVYSFETIGAIIGGLLISAAFYFFYDSFQIAAFVAFINTALILNYSKSMPLIKKILTAAFACLFVVIFIKHGQIQNASLQTQWKDGKVLEYRNSIYGNITVIENQGQKTFLYNGVPIIILPQPDAFFVQQITNFPLAFHQAPKSILVLGTGIGGIISQIQKYPVAQIYNVELDPLIALLAKKYASDIVRKELGDKRVRIINSDGILYLRRVVERFDVIIVGFSDQVELGVNRFFTEEFFKLAGARLNSKGILAFWLPGSETYISQNQRDLNASIRNGAFNAFAYCRVIPGNFNIYICSDDDMIISLKARDIIGRLYERGINSEILVPGFITDRLSGQWQDFYNQSVSRASKAVNRNFFPVAIYQSILIWNKQFFSRFASVYEYLQYMGVKNWAGLIILLAGITAFLVIKNKKNGFRYSVCYAIFTTGFFSMMISMLLIFAFQTVYGYLYHALGIFLSVFMSGIASGSFLAPKLCKSGKTPAGIFFAAEIIITFFSLSVLSVSALSNAGMTALLVFGFLFLISGLLTGIEYPLANTLYMQKDTAGLFSAGVIYGLDLSGGCLAGILSGLVFLPILGLNNTICLVFIMKLSSVIILFIGLKRNR